jgi:hypothetical protein
MFYHFIDNAQSRLNGIIGTAESYFSGIVDSAESTLRCFLDTAGSVDLNLKKNLAGRASHGNTGSPIASKFLRLKARSWPPPRQSLNS